MASMFSSPAVPKPQPLPESPLVGEEKQRQRDAASAAAMQDAAMGGRSSTVHAGRSIAMADQQRVVARRKKDLGYASDELGAL